MSNPPKKILEWLKIEFNIKYDVEKIEQIEIVLKNNNEYNEFLKIMGNKKLIKK
jgi:hypothetical protein